MEENNDIAVIGMSGSFPGADSIDSFWENLISAKCSISDVNDETLIQEGIAKEVFNDPSYVKKTASISNLKSFDAQFFGYTPNEAKLMDPQQRIFLEHSWKALESSGYIPDECDELVGVYAGCGMNRYQLTTYDINTAGFGVSDFQKMLASEKDYLTTRVSYKLNLRGPSINVQTACSTSLVSVQLAVLGLQTYQCDMALCGGVSANVPHKIGYSHAEGMIFSKDGYCKPFTNSGAGTIFGEGVGVVVLKRMSEAVDDGDNIIAVIKSAAVNNDGNNKVGYTAPSSEGQTEVVALAQDLAGIDSRDIRFVETHGTATVLGDPIELAGLTDAFEVTDNPYCALGTLKANIGHLDTAAGIASLIKTILVANKKVIPPNVSFDGELPHIEDDKTPFYFNEKVIKLSGDVYAGVSSFGVGGTNAHIIVSSPPEKNYIATSVTDKKIMLLHSGKSEYSTQANQQNTLQYLKEHPELIPDASYTLLKHRKQFDYLTFTLAMKNSEQQWDFYEEKEIFHKKQYANIIFAFSGQGSQYKGMSKLTYDNNSVYKRYFDECVAIADEITGKDFKALIFDDANTPDALIYTDNVQISLFIVEYSLAMTIMSYGVKPSIMMGHSLGEYVAACIAGVFSLSDALTIVSERGRLMNLAPTGAMLVVFSSRDSVEEFLSENLVISVENSVNNVVVSGLEGNVNRLKQKLDDASISSTILANRHPFHSPYMDEVLDDFRMAFESIILNQPNIQLISAVPGATSEQMTTVDYWVDHLRNEVNFHAAVKNGIGIESPSVVVEIGPGTALTSFIREILSNDDITLINTLPNNKHKHTSLNVFNSVISKLYCCGYAISLSDAGVLSKGQFIPLPTYHFEPTEYWLDYKNTVSNLNTETVKDSSLNNEVNDVTKVRDILLGAWKQTLGLDEIGNDDEFFEIGGDSLLSVELFTIIKKEFNLRLPISTLYKYPTITLLTEKISSELEITDSGEFNKDEPWDTTVIMSDKKDISLPILFLAGGVGGNLNSLYELSSNLGDQYKVIGLQTRGILGHRFNSSVGSMAEDHIRYIKQHQPKGPYRLLGYSGGGYTAFEIARQLEDMGDEVLYLSILDMRAPQFSDNSSIVERFKTKVAWYVNKGMMHTIKVLMNKFRNKISNKIEQKDELITDPERQRYKVLYQYWSDMIVDYYGGNVETNINLFMSPPLNYQELLWRNKDLSRGWKKVTSGTISIDEIPYGHLEMLVGDNGKQLAKRILKVHQQYDNHSIDFAP